MEAYLAGLEKARENGHDLVHDPLGRVVLRLPRRHRDRQAPRRRPPPARAPTRRSRARPASPTPGWPTRPTRSSSPATAGPSLEADGAQPQRPLWASTGVKNPDYDDTMYVVDLVVEDTVNTMPEKTMDAVADHGEIKGDQVRPVLRRRRRTHATALADAGIDYDDVIAVLIREGVDKFVTAWDELRRDGRRQPSRRPSTVVTRVPRRPHHDAGLGAPRPSSRTASTPDLRALVRRRSRPGRAAHLHRRRPPRRPVEVPARRRRAAPRCWRWPTRSASTDAARRDVRRSSTSTSPRTARCCTPRCGCPRRRAPSRSTARTSSPTCTTCSTGSTRSPTRCAAARGRASPASGSRTVVNIGIGGSDLGPVMAYEALRAVPPGRARSAASSPTSTRPTSPTTLAGLDPATTLFIVARARPSPRWRR